MTFFNSMFQEKACPVCGKSFSLDSRDGFATTRVYLSQYSKHIADIHLSQVFDQICNYPPELSRLAGATDGPAWLSILYYYANYFGPRLIEKWITQQIEVLMRDLDTRRRMLKVSGGTSL